MGLKKIRMAGLVILGILAGWGGLAYLVTQTSPGPLTQLAFLTSLALALMFTSFPAVLYLNRRFAPRAAFPAHRPWRQSGWLALFGVVCAWLQMRRALNWTVALILATIFTLIEAFILTRE